MTVLDLFGGISTGLAAVLQAGIRVHQYLYVEKDEASRRASLRHVASLVYRYPDLLPNTAVRAYQHQLPALESFGVSVSLYLDSSMAMNWHGSDVCW